MNDKNIVDLLNDIDGLYKRKNNIDELLKLINQKNITMPNIQPSNISPQITIKNDTPNIDRKEKYLFIKEVRDSKGNITKGAKIIINNNSITVIKYGKDLRVTANEYNSLLLLDDYKKLQTNEPLKLFLTANLIYLICNELKKNLQYDKIVLIHPELSSLIVYSEEKQDIIRGEGGTQKLYQDFIVSPYPYFFIVNNDPEGGHWMAVILYKDENFDTKYYIFDSGGYTEDKKPVVIREDKIIFRLLTYFIPGYEPTEALIDKNSPRIYKQINSWECGYAVCSILKKMILFGRDNKTTNYDGFDDKIKQNPNEFYNIGNYKIHRGLLLSELNSLIEKNQIIVGGNKNYKYKHDKYKQKYLLLKNI